MPGITDPDYLAWKAQQTRNNLQSRNQFRGIDVVEDNPNALGWQPIDNPPFTWPAKQYTDITGNQIQVQRGYMRSLITDPRWAANSAAKNRKLFFQFNPTVLVRSVQQTVGTMNPLLQDPAQLTMPVPGTSTFGFELLFNREKEVASGLSYLPGQQPSFEDSLVLPNGDAVLPSQIGVLADIMVLDTITGQGLSQDMLDMVKKQAQLQADTVIPVTGMTGSNTVPVKQGPTYGSNSYEPKIGDIMMVKMSNNELSIQGAPAVVDLTTPVPYLWYQVQGTSGALSTNNLLVTVDRNFANFSGYSTSNNANVIFYPLGTGGTQNSLFSSGGFFSGGCVWNMNNV
ncbi:hypothetical protein EBT31_15640, partial [bacterium]|nr:hypothetical protein [bacterium]